MHELIACRICTDRTYELCAADPVVQQAVSKLSLAMLSTTGILGCLTTAWWGSVRYFAPISLHVTPTFLMISSPIDLGAPE